MKLKPCPFCGGEAEFRTNLIDVTGGWHTVVYVWCPTCEARSHRVFYTAESDKIEAAERWNRREPMDKIVEQLEGIKMAEKPIEVTKMAYNTAILRAIEIVKGGAV